MGDKAVEIVESSYMDAVLYLILYWVVGQLTDNQ